MDSTRFSRKATPAAERLRRGLDAPRERKVAKRRSGPEALDRAAAAASVPVREPLRAERPPAGDRGEVRRQPAHLAHAGTLELDAPDYGDEVDGELSAPILSSPARASTEEIDEARLNLARKATPPLELSATMPRAETRAIEPGEGEGLSRKATPPLGLTASSPRAATQAIDDSGLQPPSSSDLFSSHEVTNAISANRTEEAVSFEIPENASIGVIVLTLLKQAAFVVAAACKGQLQPLRDSIDRQRERRRAIEENRNATLTVQERRVSKIVSGAVALFVILAMGGIIYSNTRERLPPEAVVKLLYPYGLLDGTFNGRPIAGVESVDIEYVQREPCLEYETEPHCYAYRYTARKLEGFEGKMLIGVNHDGQWQLFNPPKEVMAAIQAKTNKKKRKR